ncbi:hypothetical protein HMPREF0044_0869 [Gleimia coleocanis DSM 15436]|uniref:Uncharacterized protein n=1 Tax=Gleimia coleocanis DSM 15436 TaxID=525245 RepID=C0VZZ1_9ACTO|nr:hypothetical protein [Gleimia coleocanis]EEH63850.1 hypothetical protein HMPREF0044_0869 [Gleimia coleocanis DSM 15436]
MRLVNDEVTIRLGAALSFVSSVGERLGVPVDFRTHLHLRALAGNTQVRVQAGDGELLSRAATGVLVAAATRVLDYVGAPRVGLEVHGSCAWPLGYGKELEAVLAVAGTCLAAGLLESEVLSESELLELAVQSGACPELAACLLRGQIALGWAAEGDRGVRAVFLDSARAEAEYALLVPKTSNLSAVQPQVGLVKNLGLLISLWTGAYSSEVAEVKLWLQATEVEASSAGRLTQVVSFLRGRGIPALADGVGESVFLPVRLDGQLRTEALEAGWRLFEVPFSSEGVKVNSSRQV